MGPMQTRQVEMSKDGKLFVGGGGDNYATAQNLLLKYGNRHGLIAGATGTGKTVTLQILAEGFSNAGVPVFCADVKGDVSGLAAAGETKDFLTARAETIGLDEYEFQEFPVIFWDLFGEQGHPVRATLSEMGPLLLARLLDLNDTQEGVLNIAFRIADDEGLLLLDLKDLRALLVNIGERAGEISNTYGYVSKPSIAHPSRAVCKTAVCGAGRGRCPPRLATCSPRTAIHLSSLHSRSREQGTGKAGKGRSENRWCVGTFDGLSLINNGFKLRV